MFEQRVYVWNAVAARRITRERKKRRKNLDLVQLLPDDLRISPN